MVFHNLEFTKVEIFKIPEKIQTLVYHKEIGKALWLISELTHKLDKGLYVDYYKDFVHYLNIYKIILFEEWGMYRDALAYTCLECELYPDNANAFAYRENQATYIRGLTEDKSLKDNASNRKSWNGVAGMKDLKAVFERDVVLLYTQREIYERYKLAYPMG